MKKTLLILFASVCSLSQLFAQPTLTSANSSPKPGDAYVTQSAATAGIPTFNGGANQNWNYSNLIDSGTAIGFQALLPSATPFADSFPGSNVSVKTAGDSAFSYFTSSTSGLLLDGVGITGGTIVRYTPSRTYLPYPFTYNSFFTGEVSAQLPGFGSVFSGTDSVYGDGYGSLSIPGRTFNNVLRVEYIENLTSTFDSSIFKTTTRIRTVSHLYFSPDTHVPVLSDVHTYTTISTTVFGNTIVTARDARTIDYLKSFVLPVTFQSFKANLQNQQVALQWNTAQEVNTDHFTVQRSTTGKDFQDIASIKAKGNAQGSAYSYTDNSFAGSSVPPAVYYRIQSTDKDGKILLSDIVVVRGNTVIAVGVYPNPASSYIRISSKDALTAELVAIYDAKGSLVKQWHNYSFGQPINVANMAKGTYSVKITAGGRTTTVAVVKL